MSLCPADLVFFFKNAEKISRQPNEKPPLGSL
jgi:hypothetical protein